VVAAPALAHMANASLASTRCHSYKTFIFITDKEVEKARVFDLGKISQPWLIFAC